MLEKSFIITLLILIERRGFYSDYKAASGGAFRLNGGAAFSPRAAARPDRADLKLLVLQQLLITAAETRLDRFCCLGFASSLESRRF